MLYSGETNALMMMVVVGVVVAVVVVVLIIHRVAKVGWLVFAALASPRTRDESKSNQIKSQTNKELSPKIYQRGYWG
jgi:1,4-dihydroxy-2-naphthoate octaprenyltransferase